MALNFYYWIKREKPKMFKPTSEHDKCCDYISLKPIFCFYEILNLNVLQICMI